MMRSKTNRSLCTILAFLLVFGLLVLMLPCRALADDLTYRNPDTGYQAIIRDDANLLTDEEENDLLGYMKPLTRYGHVMFASTSSNSKSAGTYAKDTRIAQFGHVSSTIFLIDMDNREVYIQSEGAINRVITSRIAYSITDNVYRYATNGSYYTCARNAFEQELTLLEGGRIAQPMKYISIALFSLIAAVYINFLILKKSRPGKRSTFEADGVHHVVADAQNLRLVSSRTYRVESDSSSGDYGGGGGDSGGGGGGSGGGHSF